MKLFGITRTENLTLEICAHYCTTSFYRKGFHFEKIFLYQDLDRSVDARLQGVKKSWSAEICGVVMTMMTESRTSLLINNQYQEEGKKTIANARWVVGNGVGCYDDE